MLPPDPKFLPQKAADTTPDHRPLAGGGPATDLPDYQQPSAPPAALSAAPSMTTLLHAFRRAWKLGIPLALIGAALVAGVAMALIPAEYSSAIVFRIASRPAHGSLEDEGNFANVQKAMVAVLKSHEVLSDAIKESRVEEQYGVKLSPTTLQKSLVAHFNDGPEVLTVVASGENAEAVAAFLTALGKVFPEKVNGADDARVRSRIAQLRRRLQPGGEGKDPTKASSLADQLRDKRIELAQAEKDAGLDDVKTILAKLNNATNMYQRVQQDSANMKLAKIGLEATIASKQDRLKKPIAVIVSLQEAEESLKGDSEYQDLVKRIGLLRTDIEGVRKRAATKAVFEQQTAKARKDLRAMEDQRNDMIEESRVLLRGRKETAEREALQKEIGTFTDQLEQARKQEISLSTEVKRWAIEVENWRQGGPKAPPSVEALRDQLRQLERESQKVGEELASLDGSLPLNPRVTRLGEAEAYVPTEKEYKRPLKYALAGGVLVFGFLLVGVCLLEARGRRVYCSDDVTQGLGMPIVGTLPLLPASARRKSAQGQSLTGLDGQFGLTEAIDAIRTVLLHSPRSDGARVVMITSATGGEGKTTLAGHLAASLARAWRKTLLVDGDLRNPMQHTQFEQPLEPGLCEALRGEVEFDDVIKPTQVGRLWLMPAGKVDSFSLEALSQDGMGVVFEQLEEQYDFIVIDTSPVLPVPDALLLGKHSDVVLMTVMKDVSRIPAVYQAHQRLETLGIRVLGAVVIGEKVETYGRSIPYPRPQA